MELYYPFGLGMRGLDWVLPNGKEDKFSFQSKEKQTDFDLNISDFEARGYDYQINRTWQVDPHAGDYYSLSPYSFLGNNPIRMIDPTGKNFGDIYNVNGVHLGNDGKKDNQVYIINNGITTTQYSQQEALAITDVINSFGKNPDAFLGAFNLTTETGVGHNEFLDRAHWFFGEGRGEAADAYAHAIQNSKEYGYHGQGFSESGIYTAADQ
jgi:RHS repeat-associated protein